MAKPAHRPANTIDAVTELLGGIAPPVVPEVFAGGTRVTGLFINPPFDSYVPPLDHHVLVGQFHGTGNFLSKIDGKPTRHRAMPGTIMFAPRGRESYRVSPGVMRVSNVFLTDERIRSCADQIGDGRPPDLIDRLHIRDAKLFSILDLLRQEVELREAASILFIEQLLDLICIQLLRAHSAFGLNRPPQSFGLARWQVKRVTGYMRENLEKEMGLQELADLVDLSRFYFCGAFRVATGYTPHAWLTKLRIDEARRLLTVASIPVSTIALIVGYQTPSAFTARFRRVMGISPSEFRRRL